MRRIKTQTGIAHSADFEENTWTFLMPDGYEVAAGEFVIVDKQEWDEIQKKLNSDQNVQVSDTTKAD